MVYSRLYYHIVWATLGRQPWSTGNRANVVEAALRDKTHDLHGLVHAVFVRPDHVHLAITLPPTLTISDAVRDLKGSAAFLARRRDQSLVEEGFRWQGGYGVLSFGERALPKVVAYILDQDRRHADARLWDALERDDEV